MNMKQGMGRFLRIISFIILLCAALPGWVTALMMAMSMEET